MLLPGAISGREAPSLGLVQLTVKGRIQNGPADPCQMVSLKCCSVHTSDNV